jgi:hypothetical protein
MAKLNWVIFCERAVIDSASNSLSVMNVLDEVHAMRPTADQIKAAAGRPMATALACAVVTYWERSKPKRAENGQMMLRLINPKGKTLIESLTQSLDLRKAFRSRLIANLPALPIDSEGTYLWRVYLRSKRQWKPVGEVSFVFGYLESVAHAQRLQRAARKSAATFVD